MTTLTNVPKNVEDGLDKSALTPSRRNFLKSASLLVVSFSAAGTDPLIMGASAQTPASSQGKGPYHDPDFHPLDSWIVIHEDNTAPFYVGKTDYGQVTGTTSSARPSTSPTPFSPEAAKRNRRTQRDPAPSARSSLHRWEFKMHTALWAGVLSTAGGLVFSGSDEGNFFAIHAKTGKPL